MIFQTQGAIDKILRGEKTQTRRLWKPDWTWDLEYKPPIVFTEKRVMFRVGQVLSVQPGRGKPAVWWRQFGDILQTTVDANCPQTVRDYSNAMKRHDGWQPLRIRILELWREDVREIAHDDANAEGYDHRRHFLDVWTQMHDQGAYDYIAGHQTYITEADWINWLDTRPPERYDAVAIRFEVVNA